MSRPTVMLRRRKLVLASVALLACFGALAGALHFVNRALRSAVIVPGEDGTPAFSDLPTLVAFFRGVPGQAGGGVSGGAANVTVIRHNTLCKRLEVHAGEVCPRPPREAVRVLLLDGPDRGSVLWVCGSNVIPRHPLP